MVWVSIVVSLVVALISYVLTPTVKDQGRAASALESFSVPTATEDRVIPILFGRRYIEAPNVVWYGDLLSVAIRK